MVQIDDWVVLLFCIVHHASFHVHMALEHLYCYRNTDDDEADKGNIRCMLVHSSSYEEDNAVVVVEKTKNVNHKIPDDFVDFERMHDEKKVKDLNRMDEQFLPFVLVV